jgi:hypothetical protein
MRRMKTQVRRAAMHAVLMSIALLAALASGLAHAQGAWTCGGVQSAACATEQWARGCPPDRQVCDGSADALSNTGAATGCVCLAPCTSSAACGTGEACMPQLGNHCTSRFACNVDDNCPADARCELGFCRKVDSCTTSAQCPRGLPDCVRGACTRLPAGSCTSDAQCNDNVCAGPQRCNVSTNRCESTGAPAPCIGMPGVQCVATGGQARCMIPVCTSDAQCAVDPCDGPPQRCNVATGRCVAADKPCAGELCQRIANAPGLAVCVPVRDDPFGGLQGRVDRFDPGDFEIIWSIEPPVHGPGPRGYLLRVSLPAAALRAGDAPANVRVTVAGADRGFLVDGTLAAKGRTASWTRNAATGVWRWKREARDVAGGIDSATIAPQGERVRLEVRGRALAGAPAPDPAKASYAARISLDWAGAKPGVSEATAMIDACNVQTRGRQSLVACAGRVPTK